MAINYTDASQLNKKCKVVYILRYYGILYYEETKMNYFDFLHL